MWYYDYDFLFKRVSIYLFSYVMYYRFTCTKCRWVESHDFINYVIFLGTI